MHMFIQDKSKQFVSAGLMFMLALWGAPAGYSAESRLKAGDPEGELISYEASQMSFKELKMIENTSQVLRFPKPIVRSAVGSPDVADVIAISPAEIMIVGVRAGTTTLVVWENGGLSQGYKVVVNKDPTVLQELIQAANPSSPIEVHPSEKSFALSGQVDGVDERKRLMDIAEGYAPGAVDILADREPKQVLIDVFFIELDRTNSDDYGYSWQSIGKYVNAVSMAGHAAGQTLIDNDFSATRGAFTTDTLGLSESSPFSFDYIDGKTNLLSVLETLESKNFLKVIAKPKLLARDGQEADFLVGGEFPYATISGNGGTNVSFRRFGHQLKFTPIIKADGKISLTVEAVVSELNFSSSLEISGSTVPSITENSAKTVVELGNNETLLMGGFIAKRRNDVTSRVPILSDLPFMGKLFNSRDNEEREHELIFIITPHIITPMKLKGADEAGPFYKPEDVDHVMRIEELPDDTLQQDLLSNTLNHYHQNRLLRQADSGDLKTPDMTSESAAIGIEPSSQAPEHGAVGMPAGVLQQSSGRNTDIAERPDIKTAGEKEKAVAASKEDSSGDSPDKDARPSTLAVKAEQILLPAIVPQAPAAMPPAVSGASALLAEASPVAVSPVMLGTEPVLAYGRPDDVLQPPLPVDVLNEQSDEPSERSYKLTMPAKKTSERKTRTRSSRTRAATSHGRFYRSIKPARKLRAMNPSAEVTQPAGARLRPAAAEASVSFQPAGLRYEDLTRNVYETAVQSQPQLNRTSNVTASAVIGAGANRSNTLAAPSASSGIESSLKDSAEGKAAGHVQPVDFVKDSESASDSNIMDYRTGMMNFRMSENHWGPAERLNFRREQERLEKFFSEIYQK